MKIVDAKVVVTSPGRNFVTLKLTTDEGLTGLGDATLNGRELAVVSYLADHVVPLLIGLDPHRVEDTWQSLYRGAYWRRGPVTMAAIAAVDVALWDIKAEAAGLPLAGLTAYQVLHRTLKIREGDTVLVHAAAGGVGSLAVQIARHTGCRVVGTASARNHEHLRSLGAEPVEYGDGLVDRLRALVPDGFDASFDTVGGDALRASADTLAPGGRLASIADGEVFSYGGRYAFVRPDADDLARVAELAERGIVTVHVDRVFPLERAADAYRLNEEGRTRGKIVVTVDWDG